MANIINLSNYELFFIDYMDGKLSDNQIAQLHLFLDKYPNLKSELNGLSGIGLIPVQIVYADKALLLKNESSLSGSLIDDRMIALFENDMDMVESRKLLQEISESPLLQREYSLYNQTRIIPDSGIVYPFKENLIKRTVLSKMLWTSAFASAAGLALVFSLRAFLFPQTEFRYAEAYTKIEILAPVVHQTPITQVSSNSESTVVNDRVAYLPNESVDNDLLMYVVENMETVTPLSAQLGNAVFLQNYAQPVKYGATTNIGFAVNQNNMNEYKYLDQVIVENLKEKAGFEATEKLNFWKIAERSINGIAQYTGSNMKMRNTYNASGEISVVEFSSSLFGIESKMSN